VAGGAIADAGIEPSEVDAVFVGTFNSGFSKQDFAALLAMQSVPELRLKPATRCENACVSGSAALFAARHFLAAGDGRFALVIGVETMSGTTGSKAGDHLLGAATAARRRTSRRGSRACSPASPRRISSATATSPRRWPGSLMAAPLRRTDCSPLSDGVAALVLRNDDLGRNLANSLRILACAQASDLLPMSRHDMTWFEAGEHAWAQALAAAGLGIGDFSFVETAARAGRARAPRCGQSRARRLECAGGLRSAVPSRACLAAGAAPDSAITRRSNRLVSPHQNGITCPKRPLFADTP